MKVISNFINKPFAKKQMKNPMKNEVMRSKMRDNPPSTEVVLLLKLGRNEVYIKSQIANRNL
jgi:hypothetical protein